jgi:uncharacterized membrane protein
MNLYLLVVFSHIVATLGLFAGLTIEWVTVGALKRANPAETRIWINLWQSLLPLTILSAVLLLASGFYLAATTSPFRQGWIQISMLAVFIIAVSGAISNKQIRAFGKGTNGGGAVPAIVPLAVSCRTEIALGVVLLMTIKPDLTESVAVVVIAVAAGLIHGIVTRNVPRAVPSLGGIEKPEVL